MQAATGKQREGLIMIKQHIILGVHITNRVKHAGKVQQVFTEHGESIKTRLGLHDANEESGSPNGLILLEMTGGKEDALALAKKLNKIKGVEVQKMIFDHP